MEEENLLSKTDKIADPYWRQKLLNDKINPGQNLQLNNSDVTS
jgi:hypothetical protein